MSSLFQNDREALLNEYNQQCESSFKEISTDKQTLANSIINIERHYGHADMTPTITDEQTLEHIRKVRARIDTLVNELKDRGLNHDMSKLSEPERTGFLLMDSLPREKYGSAEYFEKLKSFEEILEHHYEYNRHHPEHFGNFMSEMDMIDILEMICDWCARRQDITAEDGANIIKDMQERFYLGDELASVMLNTMKNYFVK